MNRTHLFAAVAVALLLSACSNPSSTSRETSTNTAPASSSQPAASSPQGEARVIEVTGGHLRFSPSEIRVKQGETITIKFSSSDGIHDWVNDDFSASTKTVSGGQSDEVTFVASKAGTFEYYCSVSNHRSQGMVGKLIVE